MNRLENRVAPFLSKSSSSPTRKPQSLRLNDQAFQLASPHRLFIPEHFEARYEYPLFLWLHSNGSSEVELDGVIAGISLRNYIGLGLRGTRRSRSGENLFDWGSSLTSMQAGEERVLESIAEIGAQLPIHPERIFIGGYGQAGTLAQWIGLRHCDRFAGVVSIHGAFPQQSRPLVRWRSARRLPTLFMFGEHSALCDEDDVVRSMHIARTGGLNYRFNQFDCADDLYTDMCQAANRFMMGVVSDQNAACSVPVKVVGKTA